MYEYKIDVYFATAFQEREQQREIYAHAHTLKDMNMKYKYIF